MKILTILITMYLALGYLEATEPAHVRPDLCPENANEYSHSFCVQ